MNVQNSRRTQIPSKMPQNTSPGFESHAVESTTPSSEILGKKRASKPESDHLKYLFEGNLGYERRADSLKSPVPPGLTKYKMEEAESNHAKSQTDYAENYNEKLESKFILTTQRKITEDKEREDLSQNTSDNEEDAKFQPVAPKRSKMCKFSTGFVPKHLREAQKPKLSDDMAQQINFDINQLVDSTVNSRRQSEVSEEGQVQDTESPTAANLSIEQQVKEVEDN